jgi:hypothetical protein
MPRSILIVVCGFWFLTLIACAPSGTTERVSVDQFQGQVSYYPKEAGASWSYLPANAAVDSQPLVYSIEGPFVINDDIWVATSLVGVGMDGVRYRQYRPEGVFLLREVASGVEVTHDPPIQEFPPEGELRVGATWTGDTTTTLFFPDAKTDEQHQTIQVNYTYTVVDERTINLNAGDFSIFVINLVGRRFDDTGNESETTTQEIWFTPYVGEIKTREGFFLVDSNVLQTEASE